MGSFRLVAGNWHLHQYYNFAGRAVETVPKSLRHSVFLAVIIPPSRKSRVIAGIVAVCFILSFVSAYVPFISGLSEGTRIIILTVVISSAAAILFPKTEEESNEV